MRNFRKNLIALDIRGPKDGGHHVNQTEIDFCANLLPLNFRKRTEIVSLFITPFRAQAESLKNGLALQQERFINFKVKDCIIFSMVVDSLDKQGLVKFIGGMENMLNVALSRAKSNSL